MKVIVDAYNVLHQTIKTERVSDNERKHFINLMNAYAKRKGLQVIVVFDGGPYQWPSTQQHKEITIIYSGVRDTADDVIMRYLKEHQGQSIVLVSSDRELCDTARYYDAESVDAKEFYELVTKHKKEGEEPTEDVPVIKTADETDVKVDVLMEQVSKMPLKLEDVSSTQDSRTPAKKTSKKERKRWQKIKKL